MLGVWCCCWPCSVDRYKPLRAFGVYGGTQWVPFEATAEAGSAPSELVFKQGDAPRKVYEVPAETASPVPNEAGFEWLYHGTTYRNAQRLMAEGVGHPLDDDPPRTKHDFGPGFYLTPDFDLARDWARRRFVAGRFSDTPSEDAEPAVVAFKLPVLASWPDEAHAADARRTMNAYTLPVDVNDRCESTSLEWKTAIR